MHVNGTNTSKIICGWKVFPHPDHGCGPCTIRQMTPEEKKKYGVKSETEVLPETDFQIEKEEKEMFKHLGISTEDLLEECRTLGVNAEAAGKIAEKYNLTKRQVQNLIIHRKIKEKLMPGTPVAPYQTPEVNPEPRQKDKTPKATIEFNRFVPKTLKSKSINCIYGIEKYDSLSIFFNGQEEIIIDVKDIPVLIKDLTELEKILKAGECSEG